MRTYFHLLCFLFFIPLLWNVAQAQEVKTLYLSDEPLLVMDKDGEKIGLFADLFKLAAQELGRNITVKRLPWKRAQKLVQNSSGVAIGPLTRTPKREANFTWVAPLFQMRISYMSIANRPPRITTLEMAREKKIGIKRATASVFASRLHKIPEKNIHSTDSHEQLLRLLEVGRIDSWMVWDLIGYRAHKLYGKNVELVEGYSQNLGDLYFAGSKDISSDEINKWKKAFTTIIKRGDMSRLLKHYTGHPKIGGGPILAHQ